MKNTLRPILRTSENFIKIGKTDSEEFRYKHTRILYIEIENYDIFLIALKLKLLTTISKSHLKWLLLIIYMIITVSREQTKGSQPHLEILFINCQP